MLATSQFSYIGTIQIHKGINTCCAWAGGTYANYPDFCKNHWFHVIYCVTLTYVLYFKEFLTLDSCWFTIFREWLTESVRLCLFPLNTYSAGTYTQNGGRTDGRTDRLTNTLAVCGLEELFFQLCCCVSFWFWREIGFGFTYLCT
jgi:hypothetical protein